MSIFRNRLFLAANFGHLILDTFNSSGPILVAVLGVSLGLNNKSIGLAIGLYQFAGAFGQPLFGWLADRYRLPWLMGSSVAWTVGLLALSIVGAQSGQFALFLVPYVLASFGSAAFHPVGTKNAALTATRRAATATALFFWFGQVGLATGPALSGFILDNYSTDGIITLAFLSTPVILLVLFLSITGSAPSPPPPSADKSRQVKRAAQKVTAGAIIVLILHSLFRSWAQIGTVAFLPKLLQDQGWNSTTFGAALSLMWVASAFSGVLAGYAADRFGRRQVVFWVMLLAVGPLFFLPILRAPFVIFLLAFLAGGLTGAPHSIIVVIAQAMMPNKQATASGLILGLIFGMGAVATVAIGWLADIWSLERALQVGALMALLAALTALALPQTRRPTEIEPLPETESAAV
jgi:FSR family fosmidomycin resistance protein-like MFS transporter